MPPFLGLQETKNLSTDADSRTDTILKRLHDLSIYFFKFVRGCLKERWQGPAMARTERAMGHVTVEDSFQCIRYIQVNSITI